MERYPIPQFIESESKIAFFLSFRQFFYLVGAGVICFILYYFLPFTLFIMAAACIFLGAAAIAFITINGVPLLTMLMGAIGFSIGGKNYTWKKAESPYPFKPIARTHIKKIDEGPVLQAQKSNLKKAQTLVETKKRNSGGTE
jgi:cytochrome b subunit of formate dehydrogenase